MRRKRNLLRTKWYSLVHRDLHRPANMRMVCKEWLDFDTFSKSVQQPPSSDSVLCLKDPEAGYHAGNVYWGTQQDRILQCRNHKRYTFQGETLNITQWAARRNVSRPAMAELLKKYPPEVALAVAEKRSRRTKHIRRRTFKGVFDREANARDAPIDSISWAIDRMQRAWPDITEIVESLNQIHGKEAANEIVSYFRKMAS